MKLRSWLAPILGSIVLPVSSAAAAVNLSYLGGYNSGVFDAAGAGGGAEISAHDPETQRLFVVNVATNSIDVVDISNPASPTLLMKLDLSAYGGNPNSVAVNNDGLVAVAVEAIPKTDPGTVVFFDTDGVEVAAVQVGALPDMVTFTHDGRKAIVANEGEPNDAYTIDPVGSVSIIRVNGCNIGQDDVTTIGFEHLTPETIDPTVRLSSPGATVAQDLEPEYITVSDNNKTAWVSLQEANAFAIIDLKHDELEDVVGLGFKDHMLAGNALDPSDRDNAIKIANWPLHGMYQPDAIGHFKKGHKTYIVSANEGDSRGWTGNNEEVRVSALPLDPVAFPNAAALKANSALGRLTVTNRTGDTDGDGDFDEIYVFGARSFSIWSEDGQLVWDSGSQLEQITAAAYPANFNSEHTSATFDTRSDNKGPEPEGLAVGKVNGRHYAFVGLERIGGVTVWDVTNPTAPVFQTYVNTRDFSQVPTLQGHMGPEGLGFIKAGDSPTGKAMVFVTHEVSGTIALYNVE